MSTATRSLAQALELAEADLGLVLDYRALLLPEHLHEGVLEVWPVIRERFAELRAALLDAPETVDERLASVGLTGMQLEIKLRAHRVASDQARSVRPPPAAQPPIGFRRVFKSLLGWINVWLGSLVAAGFVGEAVKEYKEFLEQGVDDAENLG